MASNASAVRAAGFAVKNTMSRLIAVCSWVRIAPTLYDGDGDDNAALLEKFTVFDGCALQLVNTTASSSHCNRRCMLIDETNMQ